VPGLGSSLKDASRTFDNFKASVNNSFDSMIKGMQRWQGELTSSQHSSAIAAQAISADFARQGQAAGRASASLNNYTDVIHHNGVNTVAESNAREKLYHDLIAAGIASDKAHSDVDAYTTAIQFNGSRSDAARSARQRLINDIISAYKNSERGRTDMTNLADAIRLHGVRSDQARSARIRLETDIVNSGGDARTAKRLVDDLQASINNMHGKQVTVGANATAHGTISIVGSGWASGQGNIRFHAARGAYINRGSGPRSDDQLAAVSRGELIVPAHMVSSGMVDHLRGSIPGFANGGFIGAINSVNNVVPTASSVSGRDAQKAVTTGVNEALAAIKNMLSGTGSAIVNYASSFVGRIPYVWGGTSVPGGADCSGFTQSVYGHFGIRAPRTSESQFAWAKKTGPVPGGLAFYVSPAGGAPPGHVAIVKDPSTVISQGGGMGPQIEPLHFMPLMGTGIPPGGFPGGNWGAGGQGPAHPYATGSPQQIAMSLLKQYGWGNQWGSFNNLENREAGWNLSARNPSSGAYGMAQFINGAGEYAQYGGNWYTALGQLTAMMNYIKQRYGDPNGAWSHELSAGWYDRGGYLNPGWNLAYNGTGKPEPVGPAIRGHGDTFIINISPTPLARPADIGRDVVKAIRAYEKGSGKGWRS
jgi:hypothetical protein